MKSKLLTANINRYSLSKTLRFELIPQGKSLEYIEKGAFLPEDEAKAQDYKLMKKSIDEFHKDFISKAMQELKSELESDNSDTKAFKKSDLDSFATAYLELKQDRKSEKLKNSFKKTSESLRKKIIDRGFKASNLKTTYEKLFKKDLIESILPKYIKEKENAPDLFYSERFKGFTTHFTGFNENRGNMYSPEEKSTSIAYRLVDENFPRFLDNIEVYSKTKDILAEAMRGLEDYEKEFYSKFNLAEIFQVKAYSNTLAQHDIDLYNTLLGGIVSKENSPKIRGLNELINLYSQKSKKKYPLFKLLYKQILSDRESLSFLPQAFEGIKEVYNSIILFYNEKIISKTKYIGENAVNVLEYARQLFESLKNAEFNAEEIYVDKFNLRSISSTKFGSYDFITKALDSYYTTNPDFEYEKDILKAKGNLSKIEKVEKKKDAFIDKEYHSLASLDVAISAYLAKIEDIHFKENSDGSLVAYFVDNFKLLINGKAHSFESRLKELYSTIKGELEKEGYLSTYHPSKKTVEDIKLFLDTILQLVHYLKSLSIREKDKKNLNLDSEFYNAYDALCEDLSVFIKLYDKIRNYLSKKPYSTEKYKLTFNEPTLASGWDLNKEDANKCVIFKKDSYLYLGIINRDIISKDKSIKAKNLFIKEEVSIEDYYEKMIYKYTPDASKMIPKCSTQLNSVKEHFEESNENFIINNPKNFEGTLLFSKEIFELNNPADGGIKKFQSEYLKITGDNAGYKAALAKWISFCLDFCAKYKSTAIYDLSSLKKPQEYNSLNEFYTDLDKLLYSIKFQKISKAYIDDLVDKGALLLFKIHNKDFNEGALGTPNLHTLYWKALFSEENLADPKLRLNGGAEIFYRKMSIFGKNTYSHKKGDVLVNKTDKFGKAIPDEIYMEISKVLSGDKDSNSLSADAKLVYDNIITKKADREIIKDKRYTQNKFLFHVPILLNAKADEKKKLNDNVLESIKSDSDINVIGIDRGERHLLYYTVVNQKGEILEQKSFNTVTERRKDGSDREVDYHSKLDAKEKARDRARKEWSSVEKIADLKEGYLSNVVHELCLLVEKYNAIIILEDLNLGFKRGRFKVEKQVYQKFEKALITKLNYLAFKNRKIYDDGGILKAYQLTEKFESFKKMTKQNGILFYLAAANTSKIDPLTGFVNKLKTKYENKVQAKEFFSKFETISYNKAEACFDFAYTETLVEANPKKWAIKTSGEYRYVYNKYANNNKGATEKIDVTKSIVDALESAGIDYTSTDLKELILNSESVILFKALLRMLGIVLAMRYSKDDEDFILSPVANDEGIVFDSRKHGNLLPKDADANGAYNIARKGLLLIQNVKEAKKDPLIIKNQDWFTYAQSEAVVSAQGKKIR